MLSPAPLIKFNISEADRGETRKNKAAVQTALNLFKNGRAKKEEFTNSVFAIQREVGVVAAVPSTHSLSTQLLEDPIIDTIHPMGASGKELDVVHGGPPGGGILGRTCKSVAKSSKMYGGLIKSEIRVIRHSEEVIIVNNMMNIPTIVGKENVKGRSVFFTSITNVTVRLEGS
jgi:hypothetical protein